jgi:chromosome segregation ATPase
MTASPEAMSEIRLLSERLNSNTAAAQKESAELWAAHETQARQIEKMQIDANTLEGELRGSKEAMKEAKSDTARYVSLAMPFIVLAISGALYGAIKDNSASIVDLQVSRSSKEERLKDLESKKAPDLTEIQKNLAQFDTSLATIQSDLLVRNANNVRRDTMLADHAENISKSIASIEGLQERVSVNTRTLEDVKAQVAVNLRNLASVDAKMSAGFVEVESQMRGLQAMFIGALDSGDRIVRTIWEKVMGLPLPESKPLPTNIPAQAFTTIGGKASE